MNEMVVLIILIIPTLLILFFWWKNIEKEQNEKEKLAELTRLTEKQKITLPLKITAYERLIVMLERLKPTGLVMRVNKGGMQSYQMQLELLSAIRKEFEHNISMQMYVSDIAWELVVKAKDDTANLIKKAASIHGAHESLIKLNTEILNMEKQGKNKLINLAIATLKKEIRNLI